MFHRNQLWPRDCLPSELSTVLTPPTKERWWPLEWSTHEREINVQRDRLEIARNIALGIPDGAIVNLGIGLPEAVADMIPRDQGSPVSFGDRPTGYGAGARVRTR